MTLISTTKADVTGDRIVSLKDLVKIKYLVADGYSKDFNIAGVSIEDAAIVVPETYDSAYTPNIKVYLDNNFASCVGNEAQIIIGDADDYAKAMVLNANAYEIALVGNKLYVNGGSEAALSAAIIALQNKISLGSTLTEGCIVSFTYLGEASLIENTLKYFNSFSTDFASGKMTNTYSEWSAPTYAYATGLPYVEPDVDGRALEAKNISGTNGVVYLDASGYQDRTYTEGSGYSYTGRYYMGSHIQSKDSYTYGYFEARMRIKTSVGVCPAFWLLGKEDKSKAESTYYEFDIFECYGRLDGFLKATALKHVTKYLENQNGDYVWSDSKGEYVPFYTAHGYHLNEQDPDLALAKDGNWYSLTKTQRYERKNATFNAYNTNQFSEDNWEVLYDDGVEPDVTNGQEFSHMAGFDDGEFHKIAFEWTEDYIMWIYDDIPLIKYNFCDVGGDNKYEFRATGPMQIICSIASGVDIGGQTGVPTPCDCEGGVCTKGDSIHTDWEDGSSLEIDYIFVR